MNNFIHCGLDWTTFFPLKFCAVYNLKRMFAKQVISSHSSLCRCIFSSLFLYTT